MSASDTPRTDAVALDAREGITHPELCETYMAWTDYWALRELARQLERENARLRILLAHAVREADGWHDDSHGGPIEGDPLMDEARAALEGKWVR